MNINNVWSMKPKELNLKENVALKEEILKSAEKILLKDMDQPCEGRLVFLVRDFEVRIDESLEFIFWDESKEKTLTELIDEVIELDKALF